MGYLRIDKKFQATGRWENLMKLGRKFGAMLSKSHKPSLGSVITHPPSPGTMIANNQIQTQLPTVGTIYTELAHKTGQPQVSPLLNCWTQAMIILPGLTLVASYDFIFY